MATEAIRASSLFKAGTCTTFLPSKISRESRKSRLCFSRFFCRFASFRSNIAFYRQFVYTVSIGFSKAGENLIILFNVYPSEHGLTLRNCSSGFSGIKQNNSFCQSLLSSYGSCGKLAAIMACITTSQGMMSAQRSSHSFGRFNIFETA